MSGDRPQRGIALGRGCDGTLVIDEEARPASGLPPGGATGRSSGLPGAGGATRSSLRMVSVADETRPKPIGEGPNSPTRSVFGTLCVPWSVIGIAKVADVCPGTKSSSPLTDVKS